MKISKADLRSSALKRDAELSGSAPPEPKRARVEAEPAPAPRRTAQEKGKSAEEQSTVPAGRPEPEPEVVCTGSSAGRPPRDAQPPPVVPSPAAADAAGAAAKPPSTARAPSPRPRDEQPGLELVRSIVETGSAIREPRLARELFIKVALPRDRRLRGGRSFNETLMGAFTEIFALGNDFLALEESRQASLRREADKDKRLKALEEEVTGFRSKDQGSQTRIRELEEELRQSRAQTGESEKAFSEFRGRSEKRAAEDAASISHLSKEIRRLETENHLVQTESSNVKKKSLHYAELLEKARLEALDAIPRYRASEVYAAEVNEAATDAYLKGVSDCWVESKKFLSGPDVEKLTSAVGFSAALLNKAAESESEGGEQGAEAAPGPTDQEIGDAAGPASEAVPPSGPEVEPGAAQKEGVVTSGPAPAAVPPAGPETVPPTGPEAGAPAKQT